MSREPRISANYLCKLHLKLVRIDSDGIERLLMQLNILSVTVSGNSGMPTLLRLTVATRLLYKADN
jgi:hypothetical protein